MIYRMKSSKKPVLSATQKSKTQLPISKPFYLKYPYLILLVITIIVYFGVLKLGLTELDDKFFIVQNEHFNKDLGNIPTAFGRGLFGPTNDLYYRPMLLVDFIIEHSFFGTNPWGYHLTNLLFHLLTVCLLFAFLKNIKIPLTDSLILAAIFAVHPVLSQAVAWIPGRNDMMLMILFLAILISGIQYYKVTERSGRAISWTYLGTQFIFLILALFTKETAVVIPIVAVLITVFVLKKPWKSLLPFIFISFVSILIWTICRPSATLLNEPVPLSKMISTGISRIPAMVQYLGKIFIPVNLSVYPLMEDTTMFLGLIVLVLLAGLIMVSKSYKNPVAIIGLLWFLIFLAPVLIVPKSLNDQVFEHRLYIPLVGILMILSETILFKNTWKDQQKLYVAVPVILLFGIMSMIRLPLFKDPDTFWRAAIKDSPHSIMPRMMRVNGDISAEEREQIRRECYMLPQDQMMVHYTLGKIYMQLNQYDSAKRHFILELPYSQFADIYYHLGLIYAREKNFDSTVYCFEKVVSLEPDHPNTPGMQSMINTLKLQNYMDKAQKAINANQPDTAASCLQQVILLDPDNAQAHYNLAVLFFNTKQKQKARDVVARMQSKGMTVTAELLKMVQQ